MAKFQGIDLSSVDLIVIIACKLRICVSDFCVCVCRVLPFLRSALSACLCVPVAIAFRAFACSMPLRATAFCVCVLVASCVPPAFAFRSRSAFRLRSALWLRLPSTLLMQSVPVAMTRLKHSHPVSAFRLRFTFSVRLRSACVLALCVCVLGVLLVVCAFLLRLRSLRLRVLRLRSAFMFVLRFSCRVLRFRRVRSLRSTVVFFLVGVLPFAFWRYGCCRDPAFALHAALCCVPNVLCLRLVVRLRSGHLGP